MATFVDITGNKYNKLTVIGLHSRGNGKVKWDCRCDCGNTVVVDGANLKNGHTKSCGCEKHKPAVNLEDLTGMKYGSLTVLKKGEGRFTSGGAYKCTWICQCDCGREVEITAEHLKKGHTTSCGCKKKENKGSNFEDITGKKFGRLTVLYFIPKEERKARQYNWMCQCECGNKIKANANKLKTGLQQSCGCLKEEMKPRLGQITRKYEFSNKRLYTVYKSMIDRCTNPKAKRYKDYGGRGITVCPEWMNDYDAFARWAFPNGYDPDADFGNCTIDRIDVDGNYCPENCRWIPNEDQQNNRRNCVILEYNGEKHSMKEWSKILKVPYGTVTYHCRIKGESIEEMLNIIGTK